MKTQKSFLYNFFSFIWYFGDRGPPLQG